MKKRTTLREIEKFAETLFFDEVVDRVIEKYPSISFESISCRFKQLEYYDEDGNLIDSDFSVRARIKINENEDGQEVPDGGKE